VYNGPTNRYDALTVKFNASGVYQWHELYNGSGSHDDGGYDLYCDSIGNIYIAGGATDDTDLMDFLVIAYESDGDLLWVQTIDGYGYFDAASRIRRRHNQVVVYGVLQAEINKWKIGVQYIYMATGVLDGDIGITYENIGVDEIADLSTDSDDNFYVTGYKNNGSSGRDIITQKYDNELYQLWSQTWNGTSSLADQPYAIAVDESDGSVYVAGVSNKTGEGKNFIVLRYNASGTLQWAYSRNGDADEDDEAMDIGLDTLGNIIAAGYITGESNKDYFVEILNSSGVSQWTGRFNGVYNLDDRGQKLTVMPSGQISLTGKTATPTGDTYTTVRYTPKSILIPPDEEEASTALYFTENRGQLLDTDEKATPEIKFYSDRQSPALFFQEEGFSFVTAIMDDDTATNDTLHRVDVRFRQSKGEERIYGLEARADFHNYYLGHIPEGREKVGLYDRLIHTDIFPGIDLQYYSNPAGRKYYFVVKPGAKPSDIGLAFSGHSSLSVNGSGDLVIGTAAGNIVLPEPEAFLVTSMGEVSSVGWTPEYYLTSDTVMIGTGSYDEEKWLVIRVKEPTALAGSGDWITYFGGTNFDSNTSLDVDESDNLFVTGLTSSTAFPLIPNVTVVPGTSFNGNRNPFLVKFNDQAHLIYYTVIGGSAFDIGQDVVKMDQFVYLTGFTMSNNFPVTSGSGVATLEDGFLSKFKEADGSLSASRLIGGNKSDFLTSIDAKFEKIYLAGRCNNSGGGTNTFPIQTQGGSYSQEPSSSGTDGVILEVNTDLSLLWSSFFGGEGIDFANEILIKEDDEIVTGFYLVGNTTTHYYSEDDDCSPPTDGGFPNCQPGGSDQLLPANGYPTFGLYNDLFIAEFEGNELVWTTFFGGEGDDIISLNSQSNIAINPDAPDEISIMGSTDDFSTFPADPLTTGYHQDNDGGNVIATFKSRQLFWVTSFGCPSEINNDSNGGETINYNSGGHLIITGTASCSAQAPNNYCTAPSTSVFPLCPPGTNQDFFFQEDFEGTTGLRDCYLAKFNPNKELTYSSYLGGNGSDAIGSAAYSNTNQRIFIVGNTNSNIDFPIRLPVNEPLVYKQHHLAGHDGFIARINLEIITALEGEPVVSKQEIILYPNPSTNDLNIGFAPAAQNRVLRVFGSSGQLIRQIQVAPHAAAALLDTTALPAGIYHVALGNSGSSFIKH